MGWVGYDVLTLTGRKPQGSSAYAAWFVVRCCLNRDKRACPDPYWLHCIQRRRRGDDVAGSHLDADGGCQTDDAGRSKNDGCAGVGNACTGPPRDCDRDNADSDRGDADPDCHCPQAAARRHCKGTANGQSTTHR